ncbi:MAG: hypothetical protein RIR62_2762 [Pseudomonadota bacterium]
MRVAAAACPVEAPADFAAWQAKMAAWVADAAGQGASLLVFPEYGLMELAALLPAGHAAEGPLALSGVAGFRPAVDDTLAALAARHGVHILGPTGPVFADALPVNRATLYGPQGIVGHQDKQIMTRWERDAWIVRPGAGLPVFDTPLGRIGVLVCYDSEFPLLARSLCERGAEILLVPSATDALSGYWRVRIGAMARALENQCVVVQAPTVGNAPWLPILDENVGAAAVYGPPDRGFPPTGVLAEGALNAPGWVYADVDLEAVRTARDDGAVLTFRHWAEQPDRLRDA